MVLPCHHEETGFGVDFAFADTEYERQAMRRAEAVEVLGVTIRYATAEDLVIHKLIASRPIDIEDVKSVLLKNPRLDVEYVRRWLRDFGEALDQPLLNDFENLWRYATE